MRWQERLYLQEEIFATLVMTEQLKIRGFEDAQTFCIMMLITQGFIGIPTSSYLLRREAKEYIENERYLEKRFTDGTKKRIKLNLICRMF